MGSYCRAEKQTRKDLTISRRATYGKHLGGGDETRVGHQLCRGSTRASGSHRSIVYTRFLTWKVGTGGLENTVGRRVWSGSSIFCCVTSVLFPFMTQLPSSLWWYTGDAPLLLLGDSYKHLQSFSSSYKSPLALQAAECQLPWMTPAS